MGMRPEKITKDNIEVIRQFVEGMNGTSTYTAVLSFSWNERYMAIVEDCLIILACFGNKKQFLYPICKEGGNEEAAFAAIETYCMENGIAPNFCVFSDEQKMKILSRYPYVQVRNERCWKEYLYAYGDLAEFPGKKYARQRSSVKQFWKENPEVTFKTLDEADLPQINEFLQEYENMMQQDKDASFSDEMKACKRALSLLGKSWVYAAALFDAERMIAFCLGEICGDTLHMDFEKAFHTYKHIYQAFIASYLNVFPKVKWIDRQDDSGEKGLRTSKLRYHPVELMDNAAMQVQNELMVKKPQIPVLVTKRLVLNAFEKKDADAYNAIALDKELNRYWGYDDAQNVSEEYGKLSLLHVMEQDYVNHVSINFAVRWQGKLIGEALLYNFDFKGTAEFGLRLKEEYQKMGYASEMYDAVSDWGLYTLGLNRIFSKCFKENERSRRFFTRYATSVGEDETYYYFERIS